MQIQYPTIAIEAFLARFYGGQDLSIVPFGYPIVFLALAQAGQGNGIINIAANADFVLLGFRHRAQIGAAQTIQTKTAPFVRMTITDSGTNEPYTNAAVDLANYSDDGMYDKSLPYPRIISGRSTLAVQVTNYAPTAETYTSLEIFLSGLLVRVLGPGVAG